MSKRLKSTPFARFIIAMLVIAPLAYIGASYMNGQDGLQNIKNMANGKKTETVQENKANSEENIYQLEELQKDLDDKNQRIEELLKENEMLKEKNEDLEKQVGKTSNMK